MKQQQRQTQQKSTFTFQDSNRILNRIQFQINQTKIQSLTSNAQQQRASLSELYTMYLIFGQTGSGKSTSLYYYGGLQLQYQILADKKLPYIIPVRQHQSAKIQILPLSITTRVPNILIRKQPDHISKTIFIQIPDIAELSEQQKVISYGFLRKLMKSFDNIHILLVLQQNTLDQYEQIIKNVQKITSIFTQLNQQNRRAKQQNTSSSNNIQKRQNLYNKISLILNKIPQDQQDSQTKQKLQDVNNDLIFQQNVIVGQMIKSIIQQERLYIIKSEQPKLQIQNQQFQKIIKDCKGGSFNEQKLEMLQLLDLSADQQLVQKVIKEQGFQQKWETQLKEFIILIQYLASPSQKQQLFEQISHLVRKHYPRPIRQKQQPSQEYQKIKMTTKISPKIKSSLYKALKYIKQITQQQIQQTPIQQVYDQFIAIKQSIFYTLNLQKEPQQQQLQNQQRIQKAPLQIKNPSEQQVFYYSLLNQIVNFFLNSLQFITNILDYKPQTDQSSQKLQHVHKESVQKLKKQLIQTLLNQIKQFDISPFKKSSKSKKGKGKTITKIVVQEVKKPASLKYFAQKYRKQQIKKKSLQQSLKLVFNLPNTAFKLYLLTEYFIQTRNNQKQLSLHLQTVRQICKILDMNKLYYNKLIFLLYIPDLRKVEELLQKVLRQENHQNIDSFLFVLNSLMDELEENGRSKLKSKIREAIDTLSQKSSNKQSKKQKNDTKWVQTLINQQIANGTCKFMDELYPLMVQRVIQRQENQQSNKLINFINQFFSCNKMSKSYKGQKVHFIQTVYVIKKKNFFVIDLKLNQLKYNL